MFSANHKRQDIEFSINHGGTQLSCVPTTKDLTAAAFSVNNTKQTVEFSGKHTHTKKQITELSANYKKPESQPQKAGI